MAENPPTTERAPRQPENAPDADSITTDAPLPEGPDRRDPQDVSELFRSRLHLLQSVPGALQHLFNEDVTGANVDPLVFSVAPLISVTIALMACTVLPLGPALQIANLNIGLFFILGIGSLGVYGAVLGGRATMRSLAQFVSWATVVALALISALLLSGSLSMKEIVQAQLDQGQWFICYVPVGFLIYFVGSMAESHPAGFDLPETDSGIVASYVAENRTNVTGFRGELHVLAEYANLIIVAGLAATVFLGGWLRPLASYRDRFPGTSVELLDVLPAIAMGAIAVYCFRLAAKQPARNRRLAATSAGCFCVIGALALAGALFAPGRVMQGVHGAFWFIAKVGAYIYCFRWIRSRTSGFRFEQSMRLVWRILIPLAFVNLATAAVAILASQDTGLPMRFTTILSTLVTLGAAAWFTKHQSTERAAPILDGE
jgi:NADH-quinone oxidoreductase subunit H